MSTSNISDKIRNSLEILTEMHGISEAALCRETGISQATLWRLFNGDTDPRASTLNVLATYFHITVDQLLGNHPIVTKDQKTISDVNTAIYIPIFSLDNPDELIKMLGKITASNWKKWLEVEPSIDKSCFVVSVTCESMWPLFTEGTLLIVDPTIAPKNKNYVICKKHKQDQIIFRQYLEAQDEKLLKPANHAYKTRPLEKDDHILGVVIQSRNKFVD